MLVNMILECNQLFRIQNKKSVKIQTSYLELTLEEVTALAHHRPQVCAAQDHLLSHEQSSRAVGDHLLRCNPPIGAVCDHVLPESNTDPVEELPDTTQQELAVTASEEAGSEKMDVGQFFRTIQVCDSHGRSTAPYWNESVSIIRHTH